MLTRSGVTRLVDGLVTGGLIERVPCPEDARVCYARLTDKGNQRLRRAGVLHLDGVGRLFLAHYDEDELEQLASLLGRLPGAGNDVACTVQ